MPGKAEPPYRPFANPSPPQHTYFLPNSVSTLLPPLCPADLLRVIFIPPTPTFHREILTQPLGDSPVPPCQLFVRPPHHWPDAETYPDAAPRLAWEHTALHEL